MKLCFGLEIGRVGFLLSCEHADVPTLSEGLDTGHPRLRLAARLGHAQESMAICSVGRPSVLQVVGPRDISQVGDRVVLAIAVDVVDIKHRPSPEDIEPSKAVGWIPHLVDANRQVPILRGASGPVAYSTDVELLEPSEDPSYWVVTENLTQAFLGEVLHGQIPIFALTVTRASPGSVSVVNVATAPAITSDGKKCSHNACQSIFLPGRPAVIVTR